MSGITRTEPVETLRLPRTGPRRSPLSPTIRPPSSAPVAESSPPRITAGRARKAMLAVPSSTESVWAIGGWVAKIPPMAASDGPGSPRDREHAADVHPLGHGCLLVEGHGPHGDPQPRPVEKVHGREGRRSGHRGGHEAPVDKQRRRSVNPFQASHGARPAGGRVDFHRVVVEHPQHDLQSKGDHCHGEQRLADHGAYGQPFDDQPQRRREYQSDGHAEAPTAPRPDRLGCQEGGWLMVVNGIWPSMPPGT